MRVEVTHVLRHRIAKLRKLVELADHRVHTRVTGRSDAGRGVSVDGEGREQSGAVYLPQEGGDVDLTHTDGDK